MIEKLFLSILIGYSSAYISKILDYSFNKGNILDFYYIFLLKYIEPISPKLAKPLGMCIKCFSIWICFIVFFIFILFSEINFKDFWFYIFISQGISASIIYKKEYKTHK